MLMMLLAVPLVAAAVLVTVRGWVPEHWSPVERRTRFWVAVPTGLVLAAGAAFVALLAAWLAGPDCGQTYTTGIRVHVMALSLVAGLWAAALPLALAGRRRLALLAVAVPVIAPLVVAFASTAPSATGWCLY